MHNPHSKISRSIIVLGSCAIISIAIFAHPLPLSAATTHLMNLTATGFNPPTLAVAPGDSVKITNPLTFNAAIEITPGSTGLLIPSTQNSTHLFSQADTYTLSVTGHPEIASGRVVADPANAPPRPTSPTVSTADRIPVTNPGAIVPGLNLYGEGPGELKDPSGLTGIQKIRSLVAETSGWLLSVLTGLAIVMLIFAGYLFLTAAGEEEKLTKAKNIVKWVITGLVVAVLAWAIVKLILTQAIPPLPPTTP